MEKMERGLKIWIKTPFPPFNLIGGCFVTESQQEAML